MELGLVPAGTIQFIATVDYEAWFGLHPFEYLNSFLVAKNAVVGPKSFDCAEWVALPQKVESGGVPN